MSELKLIRNPQSIKEISFGRHAAYKAGVQSPAIWYWRTRRGDKALALRLGLGKKDVAHLIGFRLASENPDDYQAVCSINDSWYTVGI